MSYDYLRCPFCGRAVPLLSGTEGGKRVVWIDYREGEIVTGDTICRSCLLTTATEQESDRQTQRTIAEIERAGTIRKLVAAAWTQQFGGMS